MPFVQLKGKILSYEEVDIGKRNKMLVAHFSDGYGVVDLVWLQRPVHHQELQGWN